MKLRKNLTKILTCVFLSCCCNLFCNENEKILNVLDFVKYELNEEFINVQDLEFDSRSYWFSIGVCAGLCKCVNYIEQKVYD